MMQERDLEERTALQVLHAIQTGVHTTAVSKGWWSDIDRIYQHLSDYPSDQIRMRLMTIMEKMMLAVSELGEGVEGLRLLLKDDKLTEYDSIEIEIADTVIRLFDLAEYFQLRLPEAIIDKMDYNKAREFRHGGKSA